MAIAISRAFVRKDFLDTPRARRGAAALLAITSEGRLFVHRKRHTNHAVVEGGATALNERGEVDPNIFIEIDLIDYVVSDALTAIDGGECFHAGRKVVTNEAFDDDGDNNAQPMLPQCKRIKNGWTL